MAAALRRIDCKGGFGPGYFHTCRRSRTLGPALVVHHRKDRHADLVLDLRGYPLGPAALARALELAAVYSLCGWAAEAVMGVSLLQVPRVPVAVLDAVTADLLALAASVRLAPIATITKPVRGGIR